VKLLKKIITLQNDLRRHLRNPASQTYYPEKRKKSNIAIYFDNLLWMLRYGEINYYYYLYGFDVKDGANQNTYMSYPSFARLRDKANAGMWVGKRKANYICLLQDKFLFGQYLESLGFPTPRIIAMCNSKSITWIDSEQTEPLENLLCRGDLDVFMKAVVGWRADAVYPLVIESGRIFIDKRQISIEQLKELIKGKCLIQERIYQHSEMNRLYPHSVNTVRLITARSNKQIIVLSAALRAGANGNRYDNWSAGGIALGINPETGRLYRDGFFKPGFGRKVRQHPDTGVKFEDFEIPFFAEAVRLAGALHKFFYGIHSIGWDIAITNNGPVFIEGNDNWGLQTVQIHDRRLKEKFLAALPVN
jgi:hypothetical protein